MANQTEVTATPGGREVIITRVFDAPRAKVWQAFTEPELVKQWLGPRRLEMTIEKWNMKPGGSYRYVHSDEKGSYGFHGVIHGIYGQEKVVQTFEFEGLPEPGHVSLDTLLLEDLDGSKTKVTTISVFQTVEDRDGMVQSGMEGGVTEGHQRLDELLISL
jgi:uncharacterized protein YndB with AHSA1/START domain